VPPEIRIVRDIAKLDAGDWNRLAGPENPFTRHEYLLALEQSGCVGPGTGWEPMHLVGFQGGRLSAALPLYRKSDSWGEFVFDWAWGHAYQQAGIPYYPKLVCAVPFTPVTGPRLLADTAESAGALVQAALELAVNLDVSSLHVLFPDVPSLQFLAAKDFVRRQDCQFHWKNRGYGDFEHFLASFTAKQRKNVRRERRRIAEAGITFKRLRGAQLDASQWDFVYRCYANTFLQRGRSPYLNPAFFEALSHNMGENILIILALQAGQPLAMALCFIGGNTLYGRYWGSVQAVHSLHFETCYYQGIEACLELGLDYFDPGTQGEHKLTRGFDPVMTHSAHWIAHPAFRQAIARFVQRESQHVHAYQETAREWLPFRRGGIR